jgi:cytochrome c
VKTRLRLSLTLTFVAAAVMFYLATNPAPTTRAVSYPAIKENSPKECRNASAIIPLRGNTCGKVQELELSCYVPDDIIRSKNLNTTQRSADIFSWQEFIALNWVAKPGERGVPDWQKKITDTGPRVWETWKEEYEIYLPDGRKPDDWNTPERLPATCDGANKHFFRTQKIDDVVDSTLQAAAANGTLPATLTDQKGHLVRYEIRLNKIMFDYIVEHRLYDGSVQAEHKKAISFPDGGILIKAAWRDVSPDEERFYHTVTACVCDKNQFGQPVNCQKKRMGLVGFHITQKTHSSPQWIWSTFEQINNVPDPSAKGHPSFYNPQCKTCPPNKQTKPGTPNQITRAVPIPTTNPDCSKPEQAIDHVRLLNANVQLALSKAGSVFQYYELINTQFPLPPTEVKPHTKFSVLPTALANTTMESFVQRSSSCMGCHSTARTVNPDDFVSSDFSFTLNNAMPKPASKNVIPPPANPVSQWDKDNWAAITRGYNLATQTYELLPQQVPVAKLHCSSCHLNGGANKVAAWWVDLKEEYPTTPQLQARINQCFTNSLNGKVLCTPAGDGLRGDCDANANMNAFLKYMEWLNQQWANTPHTGPTPHGFPHIPDLIGDAKRGQQIFVQKCAVCHGLDGQGRYEGNRYFRPALWGPHSFNQAAGMFAHANLLAGFARSNMPYGAGGQLTPQEAWDVQAYIDLQPRPGKPTKR